MNGQDAASILSPTHRRALRTAYLILEKPDFASRLASAAGKPLSQGMKLAPRMLERRLTRAVEAALTRALGVAIRSLGTGHGGHVALVGASGAVSGFFGAAGLAFELPVTTTLMLRAIADVAQRHGEDLRDLDARLHCVAVMGLGGQVRDTPDIGYYAARATLGRVISDATNVVVERGMALGAAPAINAVVTAVAPRFGVVVTERAAASALPALGALGGATLNMLFVRHFERAAHGHFTIRRLEREYGAEPVRAYYAGLRLVPDSKR